MHCIVLQKNTSHCIVFLNSNLTRGAINTMLILMTKIIQFQVLDPSVRDQFRVFALDDLGHLWFNLNINDPNQGWATVRSPGQSSPAVTLTKTPTTHRRQSSPAAMSEPTDTA